MNEIDRKLQLIDRILCLEAKMQDLPKVSIEVSHEFCDGVYARSVAIPKGTIATGMIHKKTCLSVLRYGILILSGETYPKFLYTGQMSVTESLTKRAVFAITDSVFTTFHANPDELRDQHEIIEAYTYKDNQELLEEIGSVCHLLQ